jgi:hypothetical protein
MTVGRGNADRNLRPCLVCRGAIGMLGAADASAADG